MATLWADSLPNFTVASGARDHKDLRVQSFGASDLPGRADRMTLTRTIIGIDVAMLVHDSGEGSQQVFLGLGICSAQAFSAGDSGIPDPFVMVDFPPRGWIWRASYRVYGFAADQPAVFNARIDLDIRGQRKLENGVAFMTVTNTPFEGVATVITVSGIVRQLWLV